MTNGCSINNQNTYSGVDVMVNTKEEISTAEIAKTVLLDALDFFTGANEVKIENYWYAKDDDEFVKEIITLTSNGISIREEYFQDDYIYKITIPLMLNKTKNIYVLP